MEVDPSRVTGGQLASHVRDIYDLLTTRATAVMIAKLHGMVEGDIYTDQFSMQLLLDEVIINRHSTRGFLKDPIPRSILERALNLAQHAPSNSNVQPWRLRIVSGAARDRLANALLAAASAGEPNTPPLPAWARPYRSNLGRSLFGGVMGIPKDDVPARLAAELRNYNFFGAPTIVILTMDKNLSIVDSLSVGMYLQLLLLVLHGDGVDSCVQASVAGYPEVVRKELDISIDQEIICGVALGYSDPDFRGNVFRATKEPFTHVAQFIDA